MEEPKGELAWYQTWRVFNALEIPLLLSSSCLLVTGFLIRGV
jgi:hypothetical protein